MAGEYDSYANYGVPYGLSGDDLSYFFGDVGTDASLADLFASDLANFGVSNPAWYDYTANEGLAATDPSFWSSLTSGLGNAVGGLTSGLSQSGLGTLAGMLGTAYGIQNQYDWQQLLGQGRDLAEKTGSLISGWTPYTNQMINMSEGQKAGAALSPELFQQGGQALLSSGTYDPNELNKYLNPYAEDALTAANRLTTQNLMEKVLPEVNTTFTGQGQFGSTRNAEFANRAIRDTQQSIADANAKAMVGAYGQASDDYLKMLQQQQQMGNTALTQGATLGALPVEQYQKVYTSPLDMFQTWGQGVGQFNPAGATGSGTVDMNALTKALGG